MVLPLDILQVINFPKLQIPRLREYGACEPHEVIVMIAWDDVCEKSFKMT